MSCLSTDTAFARRPGDGKSSTLDNKKEFAEHQQLAEDLELDIYFAKPYASWQRGTNERPRKRLDYRTPKEVLAKKLRCN